MATRNNRRAGRWPYNNPSVFRDHWNIDPRKGIDTFEQSPLTDEWGSLTYNGGHIPSPFSFGKEEDYE